MISMACIKQCVDDERYRYSLHGDRERLNDLLSLNEVEQALLSGRILEQYADTGRAKAALLPASPIQVSQFMWFAGGWVIGWSLLPYIFLRRRNL